MKELKKQLVLRWDEILFILSLEAGFFILGEIMLWAMVHIRHEDELLEIGTLLTLIITSVMLIFFGISTLVVCFNTGISMGTTRKRLIPAFFIITYLECMTASAFAFLLHKLELWILRTFYTGMKTEFVIGQCFHLKYILTASLAIVALNALFGTLFLKFGKVSFIVIWLLWMFCFTIGPRLIHVLTDHPDTVWGKAGMHFLQSFTEGRVITTAIIVSAFFFLASWFMLRRQQVRL